MPRLLLLFICIGLIFSMPSVASAQECDSLLFTVYGELTNDPGYEGMYKYTISGYWEVSGPEQGWGLSHVLFSLGALCPCLCDSTSDQVLFPDPAGISTGVDLETEEPCDVAYIGSIECDGLEDITNGVVIKYEVPDGANCEPIHYGSGTWIFYSTMPPLEGGVYIDKVFIKYGEMMCDGAHFCEPPNCFACAPISVEKSSWGAIKAIYR